MQLSDSPLALARALTARSTCAVKVAAVIYDRHGIFSWGWNHMGPDGLGQHAEVHALRRANRTRLKSATIVVVGRRRGKVVFSFPCATCLSYVKRHGLRHVITEYKSGEICETFL